MFGLVNFRINLDLQNMRGGDQRFLHALEWRSQPGAGNNVNKHTVNSFLSAASTVLVYSYVMYCRADDSDIRHQMYTNNDIVSLVLSEKSGQDNSNESDSDEATTEVISHMLRDWKRWNMLCCM
jgi:hypothetical protein